MTPRASAVGLAIAGLVAATFFAPPSVDSGRLVSLSSPGTPPIVAAAASEGPIPNHVVVVVLENHSKRQIIGARSAPFINSLARRGALMTRSRAIRHPSQPNYIALFSGSTHGVGDDRCPLDLGPEPNLAASMLAVGKSFVGYSQGLPRVGFRGCRAGNYVRKHNPWVDFANVPTRLNRSLHSWPSHLSDLPDVAFVVPNLQNDMHDGSIAKADTWLERRIGRYAKWATSHRSWLIVTFDEDDYSSHNRIPTIVFGAKVKPGKYGQRINHYNVLRTLTDAFKLDPIAKAASVPPIKNIWKP